MREGNEDSGLASAHVIAVADGMGGHVGGEIASSIAIRTLSQIIPVIESHEIDSDSREDLFLNIAYSVDQEIAEKVGEKPELSGMGTTLTSLSLHNDHVELLHIGDSRCYRWNGKKLEQLSYDHTVMQELIDQGRLTPDEVHAHPQRSILTQALMGDNRIDPILNIYPVRSGDRFLLCSDGLTSVLSDLEIINIIKQNNDVVADLTKAVLEKGAPDNVTIIWATVEDLGLADESHVTTFLGAARSSR